ncbi:hypothetical protein C2G38_1466711 [Gigaspora rosea]|uniref:Uncharacterized protein n=1 Tax=Gigaspora rosea TaxID=44941 RepID=A0A397V7W2_9GLOM|nr:hypothetical protein C2G38_1466711 [Gigaspora rosea]
MENIHTIDSLRELNAKLLAEIAKLRKENDKIPVLEAENAKLKQIIEENMMRDARVKELEQKNTKLEARLAILEQASLVETQNVDQQNNADTKSMEGVPKVSDMEIDDFIPEEPIPKVSPVNLPQPCQRYPKSLEEKENDSFMDSENKKMVSNEMRERNREKKIQAQVSHNASSMSADCNKISDTEAEEEPCGDLEKWSRPKSHDTKTVTNLSRSDHVSSEVSKLEQDDEINEVDTNQVVEQGLMQELSQNQCQNTSILSDVEIDESYIQNMENELPGSAQSLSHLFNKAVKKGQEEILCWYYYSFEFENRVKSLIADYKIKDKTARTKIYKEMKPFLPHITDSNLRKKTQRARKILKLFGEGGVDYVTSKTVTNLSRSDHISPKIKVSDLAKSLISNPSDSKANVSISPTSALAGMAVLKPVTKEVSPITQ